MRIGVDATGVTTGGSVSYFANLLPALVPLLTSQGHELIVYTRAAGRVAVPGSPALIERRVAPAFVAGAARALWGQASFPRLARSDRLDVFYGPHDNVPLALACPSMCAFRNPNIYADRVAARGLRLAALRALASASGRRCRRALFVSAAARDVIAPVLRLESAKARVVHHGLGDVFRAALATSTSPWQRPYLLMVSTLYDYKNAVRLVEAFHKRLHLGGFPHGLALVGAQVEPRTTRQLRETIRRLDLEEHVRLVGESRYPDVAAWYRHATAFVFPSYRETFGHPILESMAADLPLAAADIPVTREIAGASARYFDPFSVDSIGEAMVDVLDPDQRDARVRLGRQRLLHFTWERAAQATLQVMEEAAASR